MNGAPSQIDILQKRLLTFGFLHGLEHEILVELAKSAVWKIYSRLHRIAES